MLRQNKKSMHKIKASDVLYVNKFDIYEILTQKITRFLIIAKAYKNKTMII